MACAGSGKGASGPSEDAGDTFVTAIEELAGHVEAAGDGCDEFAEHLSEWLARERASLEAVMRDLDHSLSDLDDEEIDELEDRLTGALEVVIYRASTCEEHAGAREAFAEFDAALGSP